MSPLVASVESNMKLCQKCQIITADTQNYCGHDGQPLVADPLATALQESTSAKYTVTRLIGTGSMGAVYRAQHHALGDVAIKVMLGPPDNQKLSERFLREAKALRKLQTPHAVLVYDLERSPTGLTYMVMEMVEGHSLRDELKKRGHLSLEETIEIAEAVCDALEAAHERGIIHRDLKPDNILLAEETATDEENARLIKIVDFGIVKLRGTQQGGDEASMQLTKYGTPIGTPFYMSPEQWFGDGPGFTALDGRTDIYAVGCTLYEALSGNAPFVGQTKEEMRRKHLNESPVPLHEIAPHVPESISRVILRALEKDRDFRPASAAEFAAELRRAFDESLGAAINEGEWKRSRAKTKPPESDAAAPTPEQTSQLQVTEELIPLVRNWAAGEAQAVIEQVRERPTAIPQAGESQALRQAAAEAYNGRAPSEPSAGIEDLEATLEPGKFRFEADRLTADAPAASSAAFDPERTLVLQHLTSPVTAIAGEAAQEKDKAGETCELVLAQAGAWHIGLLAGEVESVSAWQPPVPLPHAPPAVLGVVSVRGRMLTVFDPSVLLGEGDLRETKPSPAFIIALRGDEQLALAVTRFDGTIGIFTAEIELPAHLKGANVMRGIVQGTHGQTIVLDSRELFPSAMQGAERRRKR
jgi:serine/threonine protein kinase/chemotaxis signal transduction protein